MDPALDDVEFLARSESRVEVLEAIAEAPRARHELRDLTGASRVTVNRILDDLEQRGWIVREDGRCETTKRGTYVAEQLTRLLDNLGTLHDLGEHVEWIHLDEFDFELCHLRDASVVTPTWDDFSAYTSTLVDLVSETTDLRAIGTGLHPEFVRALGDATIDGDLSLELVYEPDVLEAIESDPEIRRLVAEMVDTGRANVYRYQGDDSLMMLGIHETRGQGDDVVLLCGQHDEGAPPGTVETTDAEVRSWAESYFESVRADSRPLDADPFVVDRPETT